jgi:hypothetical protein
MSSPLSILLSVACRTHNPNIMCSLQYPAVHTCSTHSTQYPAVAVPTVPTVAYPAVPKRTVQYPTATFTPHSTHSTLQYPCVLCSTQLSLLTFSPCSTHSTLQYTRKLCSTQGNCAVPNCHFPTLQYPQYPAVTTGTVQYPDLYTVLTVPGSTHGYCTVPTVPNRSTHSTGAAPVPARVTKHKAKKDCTILHNKTNKTTQHYTKTNWRGLCTFIF